jgi:hypothetical protein
VLSNIYLFEYNYDSYDFELMILSILILSRKLITKLHIYNSQKRSMIEEDILSTVKDSSSSLNAELAEHSKNKNIGNQFQDKYSEIAKEIISSRKPKKEKDLDVLKLIDSIEHNQTQTMKVMKSMFINNSFFTTKVLNSLPVVIGGLCLLRILFRYTIRVTSVLIYPLFLYVCMFGFQGLYDFYFDQTVAQDLPYLMRY